MMYFVSLTLTFNLRPNLEVNEYCEGQNLAKCYNERLKYELTENPAERCSLILKFYRNFRNSYNFHVIIVKHVNKLNLKPL